MVSGALTCAAGQSATPVGHPFGLHAVYLFRLPSYHWQSIPLGRMTLVSPAFLTFRDGFRELLSGVLPTCPEAGAVIMPLSCQGAQPLHDLTSYVHTKHNLHAPPLGQPLPRQVYGEKSVLSSGAFFCPDKIRGFQSRKPHAILGVMDRENGLQMREYQRLAVAATLDSLSRGFTPLLVAPTGSGKTVMAAYLARWYLDQGLKVLFLAPRRELVHQTVASFARLGMHCGVVMAGCKPRPLQEVQVASVLTLHSRIKRGKALPEADLVICDEAHLYITKSSLNVLAAYREQARVMGMTATPSRQDGRALGQVFDRIVEAGNVAQLTQAGFLVPSVWYVPSVPDLKGVKTDPKTKDYVPGQLDSRMNQPKLVGDVVQHWIRHASGRRTVVFATSIRHSAALCEEFVRCGIPAEHVDATTPTGEREAVFERFRKGETLVLTNCFLASYGFDLPDLSCVVLARPTKSLVLYLQMVGRGLRSAPDKSECLVMDHAGAYYTHGRPDLPQPWTLDGSTTLQERIASRKKERREPRDHTCGDCGRVFAGSRACPGCGWLLPPPKAPVPVIDRDLVAAGAPSTAFVDEARCLYAELLGYADQKGYKRGWAWHKFKEVYKKTPSDAGVTRTPHPARPSTDTLRLIKYLQIKWAKSRKYRARHAAA